MSQHTKRKKDNLIKDTIRLVKNLDDLDIEGKDYNEEPSQVDFATKEFNIYIITVLSINIPEGSFKAGGMDKKQLKFDEITTQTYETFHSSLQDKLNLDDTFLICGIASTKSFFLIRQQQDLPSLFFHFETIAILLINKTFRTRFMSHTWQQDFDETVLATLRPAREEEFSKTKNKERIRQELQEFATKRTFKEMPNTHQEMVRTCGALVPQISLVKPPDPDEEILISVKRRFKEPISMLNSYLCVNYYQATKLATVPLITEQDILQSLESLLRKRNEINELDTTPEIVYDYCVYDAVIQLQLDLSSFVSFSQIKEKVKNNIYWNLKEERTISKIYQIVAANSEDFRRSPDSATHVRITESGMERYQSLVRQMEEIPPPGRRDMDYL